MSVNVRVVKDGSKVSLKRIDKMVATLKEGSGQVGVGIPDTTAGRGEGITNAQLGAIFEYGAPNAGINEMPWLRTTIAENANNFKRLQVVQAVKMVNGAATMADSLELLGIMAQGYVQRFVANNGYAISEETIKRKGSSKALIDTGNFYQSISYKVDP